MTYNEQIKKLKALADTLKLNSERGITKEMEAKTQELLGRMEFRLKELLDESRKKENEIKIEIYEEIVKLFK